MPKTSKIKIHKQDRATGTHIDVQVNGQKSRLAVDQEITVPEHVLEVLQNSSISFDVVGGDGGVSSSSTAPLTDTATRETPNIDPLNQVDGDGDKRPVPVLGADAQGGGVAGAAQPDVEPAAAAAATNADGQGAGADASKAKAPAAKKPAAKKAAAKKADTAPKTDTASRGAGDEKGDGKTETK